MEKDIRKWKELIENHLTFNPTADDSGEHDHEASMARGQLYHIAKDSLKLLDMIQKGDNLEGWVASKITKAKEDISVVADYMEAQQTVNKESEQDSVDKTE